MAEKKLSLDLEVNKGGAEKSVKSIKTELREAKAEAIEMARKFGELSPEATKAAKKLAGLRDEMQDLNGVVQGLNPDKFARMATLTNGLVRGFQAAQGAMVIFGKAGEDIEKSIQKLQGVMALADGIQGVLDARKQFVGLAQQVAGPAVAAFKKLGTAMRAAVAATGIGLLIAGISALIAYWDDIAVALGGVNKETKKNLDTNEKQVVAADALLEAHKASHETQKLAGKTEKEILQDEIKLTEELITQQQVKLEGLKTSIKEQVIAREQLFAKWGGKYLKAFGMSTAAEIKTEGDKSLAEQEKVLAALVESVAKSKNQITAIDKTANDKATEDRKKAKADSESRQKKEAEDAKKAEQDKYDRYKREHEAQIAFEEEEEKIREERLEYNRKGKAQFDQEVYDEIVRQQEIDKKKADDKSAKDLKDLEAEKKHQEAMSSLKAQALTASFDLLFALNQQGEDATEEQRKKSFERNKALAVAETIITTYQAAALAYKNGLVSGDVTQTASILGAAVAIAQGLAKLAVIKKQTYKATSTPTTSEGGGGTVPAVQATGTGFTTIAQPNRVNAIPTPKPIKVIVVQKDLDKAQQISGAIKAKAVVK